MTSLKRTTVAVCGAGSCDEALSKKAEAVGRAIAESGAALICGGLGGVMEAAAKGAKEAGGLTIGVLPGPDHNAANPWIVAAVATDMSQARNAVIVKTADAVIAVGGAYGTLSEVALALKIGKPVVSLGSWQISDDVISAANPAEAVRTALSLISRKNT